VLGTDKSGWAHTAEERFQIDTLTGEFLKPTVSECGSVDTGSATSGRAMATADVPPVLEPIQVDFSRIIGTGMTTQTGSSMDGGTGSSLDMESPMQTNEQPAEQLQVDAPASRGSTEESPSRVSRTGSTEESPLPRQSGLTFDEMVERALAEGGGSPFGVQQLSGHLEGRRPRPPPQTSDTGNSPLGLADESGATLPTQACCGADTPRRSDEDEEMQEFIGLEERLQRGDKLTEEEQLLCRTPSTLPAGDIIVADTPGEAGSEARPADIRLNAALAWAGLGADRDHVTGTECVARPPTRSQGTCRFAYCLAAAQSVVSLVRLSTGIAGSHKMVRLR
jgi:hypothetical protein